MEISSMAEEIGLFGLRKKLKKAEEEAVDIMKEGIESAEKGVEAAERQIEAVKMEIEMEVRFGGGLMQAGVVAGAEVVGITTLLSHIHRQNNNEVTNAYGGRSNCRFTDIQNFEEFVKNTEELKSDKLNKI
ncbi:unnamed protein product [Lactuca saligna]|uniref:Uncharacterized protein n=1 Tax=Lactuca saligna TaxID=75948 RepID=A0AA35YFL2_LACSI|nr:unnamed protein product [Lactuca saligna]